MPDMKDIFTPPTFSLSNRVELLRRLDEPSFVSMVPFPLNQTDDVVFITKGVAVACGTVPEPFDGLAHIRNVARGRK